MQLLSLDSLAPVLTGTNDPDVATASELNPTKYRSRFYRVALRVLLIRRLQHATRRYPDLLTSIFKFSCQMWTFRRIRHGTTPCMNGVDAW